MHKILKTTLTITIAVLLVLYPVLVYAGLQYLQPRWIAIALIVLFGLRLWMLRQRVNAARAKEFIPVLLAVSITSAIVILQNDDLFLRFNPALINLNFLLVFGYTLYRPPSMIERFARLEDPDLPASGIAYTRKVTKIWCVFFILNGSIACWSAFQSLAVWTLYNGLISYVAMGLLFGGEFIVRQFHKKAHAATATPSIEGGTP